MDIIIWIIPCIWINLSFAQQMAINLLHRMKNSCNFLIRLVSSANLYLLFSFNLINIMLERKPKISSFKWLKRGALSLFIAESIGFVVCYTVWHRVNTNRGSFINNILKLYLISISIDSRKYLRDNYPYFLESYYKVGEFLESGNNIREIDNSFWNAEEK